MSTTYKEEELGRLISGETWGLCTTTSFGMVCTTRYLDGDPMEGDM